MSYYEGCSNKKNKIKVLIYKHVFQTPKHILVRLLYIFKKQYSNPHSLLFIHFSIVFVLFICQSFLNLLTQRFEERVPLKRAKKLFLVQIRRRARFKLQSSELKFFCWTDFWSIEWLYENILDPLSDNILCIINISSCENQSNHAILWPFWSFEKQNTYVWEILHI